MADRVYRLLLHLLPRRRRLQCGDDMATVFAQQRRDAATRGGALAVLALWVRDVIGLIRFAARERLSSAARDIDKPAGWRSGSRALRFWANLARAIRGLGHQPGLAAASIAIVGIGVGITTAVFAVVNGALLRPLPFPDSGRLVDVWEARHDGAQPHSTISALEAIAWHDRVRSFDKFAVYRFTPLTITGDGPAVRLIGYEVSADLFPVIGRGPLAGRVFQPGELGPGSDVAILNERIWRSRFGSDPSVIGRRIDLDGESRTVVGVVAADAAFPSNADLWIPLRTDLAKLSQGQHSFSAVARLAAGRTLGQARDELTRVAGDLEREYPNINQGHGIGIDPLLDAVVGGVKPALGVLFVTALLVLLIATANVSGLLIARSLARQREFAVRRALGATSGALAGQLVAEGLALALPGGAVGLLIAAWAMRSILNPVAWLLPRADSVHIDTSVIVFAVLATVIVGCGAQLVPLLRASRGTPGGLGVRDTTPDRQSMRARHAIVAGQIALAFALLCSAMLLVRTLLDLSRVNPGFSAANVVTFSLQLSQTRFADPQRRLDFVRRALDALSAEPGVTAAGVVSDLPFSGSRSTTSFEAFGRTPAPGQNLVADFRIATPQYFRAMGVPLVEGRDFANNDHRRGEPVAIVNHALATRLWPGHSALGERIQIGDPEEVALFGEPVWRTIVGIVSDIIHDDLRKEPTSEIYVPLAQSPTRHLAFAVRTSGNAEALSAAARDRLAQLEPDEAIYSIRTMADRVDRSIATPRLVALLTTVFALTAVLLAAVGLHATLSYAVGQRSREFGIRLALGARPAHVLGLVWRETAGVVMAGLLVGAVFGWLMAHWLASNLFGVRPGDPITPLLAGAAVVVIGGLAALRPARRALRGDPVRLLRTE